MSDNTDKSENTETRNTRRTSAEERAKKESGRQKFVVHKATIKPNDGTKYRHGDIVELDAEEARRYNGLGYLRPYVEDKYDETEYAGRQNITEGVTSMAGAVEGAVDEDVSEVTYGETDPGTHSRTTNPEVRGDPETHPIPMTGTERLPSDNRELNRQARAERREATGATDPSDETRAARREERRAASEPPATTRDARRDARRAARKNNENKE